MKKMILTTLMAVVAIALCFTSCKPEYTTYTGPNYILFSDTLYEVAVVDNESYFDVPVVATCSCDYDRNVAVEVIDAESNAVEGKHYSIESNTVTIKAGELRGNLRVKGYHSNIDVADSLGFKVQLIIPDDAQWDIYGNTANVVLRKACKFDINAFTGYCVVSSTYIMNYMNVDKILTYSVLDTEEKNESFEFRLRQGLGKIHTFHPEDQSAVWIWNQARDNEMMNRASSILQISLWVLGMLTLLSGVVGVSNIMLITVKERTHEFGIRKALGAKPYSILSLIITESIAITTFFGYIGMIAGIAVTEYMNAVAGEQVVDVGVVSATVFVNPTVDMHIAIQATLTLIIAGTLAGFFPARKAVMIRPIEALRG